MWYGVFVFGMMGAARGLDEGQLLLARFSSYQLLTPPGLVGTTASLPSFKNEFGLKEGVLSPEARANRLSNITSMVQLGSILGALIGFYVTDKIGRLWATRELALVWVTGIAIYLAAASTGSLGMVYAGRFIAGVGIGQTTVVAVSFQSAISHYRIRN